MTIELNDRSHELYSRACEYIPGGVNSPVRAFQSVDSPPVFVKSGKGAYIIDVDGKHYIDYIGSWGPLILGHAHPKIVKATTEAIQSGLSFGLATEMEVSLASLINEFFPAIEMVRMVNSGTEATMSAIRLARGFTGRPKIIKFAGCYHGHSDSLLVNAGSGGLTLGIPSSLGVPTSIVQHTLTADFNDLSSVEALFKLYPQDIAAIIVEPIAGNMGCVPPLPGFLQGLRELCDHYQALLIFDEVITGFRVAPGGASSLYQIKPDITTLGKIIGGGMPVGAFGASRAIMEYLAPLGGVYQAGTLSGNPIAMAAGYTTLTELKDETHYNNLEMYSKRLAEGLKERAEEAQVDIVLNRVGSMFTLFFTSQEAVTNLNQVKACHVERFKLFFRLMLKQGIYLAPSAFESGFLSICHKTEEVDLTLNAAERAFESL